MVVVDGLDEGLDAAPLLDLLLAHAPRHPLGVALNAGHDGEGERVRLGAGVIRLDDDNLLRGSNEMSATVYPMSASSRPIVISLNRNVDILLAFPALPRIPLEMTETIYRTFLPAKRPRVMMATRPGLMTVGMRSAV